MKKAKKILTLVACAVLLVCISVGATIAYLTANTEVVTNTFTIGNVNITLNEGDVYDDEEGEGTTDENRGTFVPGAERVMENSYQLIPDSLYQKDPTVTVVEGSEDCYLFVEFNETVTIEGAEGEADTVIAASDYITYNSALQNEGWTQGDGEDIPSNVWYRIVEKEAAERSWVLLNAIATDDKGTETTEDDVQYHIQIKNNIANGDMDLAEQAKLTWQAYAIQKANIADAAEAWTTLATVTE